MTGILTDKGVSYHRASDGLEGTDAFLSTFRPGSLILVYADHPFSDIYYLGSPELIKAGCLDEKLIISQEAIRQALFGHESFNPLRSILDKYPSLTNDGDIMVLLVYFYLNPFPFSVSLISTWLEELKTGISDADRLAESVFEARTNRTDEKPWFYDSFSPFNLRGHCDDVTLNGRISPDDLPAAFNLMHNNKSCVIQYDALQLSWSDPLISTQVICLDKVMECGFLVEDHAALVVGLATTVTELAKLAEAGWPRFLNLLLESVPLTLRDFYSTGRLLTEMPDLFRFLITACSVKIGILSATNETNQIIIDFGQFMTGFSQGRWASTIPVCMIIYKPENRQNSGKWPETAPSRKL